MLRVINRTNAERERAWAARHRPGPIPKSIRQKLEREDKPLMIRLLEAGYKLVDVDGNIFIWYASRPCSATGGETIKATVKDHGERNGVKQTIVTRCSIAA